jgi:hypothetical protein
MRRIWTLHWGKFTQIYPCNYNPLKSFVKTKEWFYSSKVVEGLFTYIKISFLPNVVEQNAIKDKFSLPTSNLLFQILWSKRGISDHMFQPIRWWEKYGKHASRLQHLEKYILSQDWSVSICERNWSTLYMVQTKKRKRSLMQQMKRIVFVRVNLNAIEDHI